MTRNAVTNVLAGLLLAAILGLWVFAPHHVVRPVALVVLAVGVAGVFAVRAYLQRLEAVVEFLEVNARSFTPGTLAVLLTSPERRLLRLGAARDAAQAVGALRAGLSFLTGVGLLVGVCAAGAGLLLLLAYSG